ncbi:cytochrome P450 [Streptomyces lydicus]|nr:cytochrome P450 [Streptomyces lydicus]MCZ1005987.1 cytochrome P450 [Streptomyces lydicus]
MTLVDHCDDLVRRPGPFHRSLTALPVILPTS